MRARYWPTWIGSRVHDPIIKTPYGPSTLDHKNDEIIIAQNNIGGVSRAISRAVESTIYVVD
jgi:hypothetical protein